MKGSELKMKHTKEEILNALHVIKETCEEYDMCDYDCPFYSEDHCRIRMDTPDDWIINDDGVESWKGLL